MEHRKESAKAGWCLIEAADRNPGFKVLVCRRTVFGRARPNEPQPDRYARAFSRRPHEGEA
jgi:hypothetical protein